MPLGTCDPASRGETYNQQTLEVELPDGSGHVLIDVRFGDNGTSTFPDCDGPIRSLWTRNTGDATAWALLPNKKKAPAWVAVNPGDDITVTAKGTLNNLGLVNFSDAAGVGWLFTDPATAGLLAARPVRAKVRSSNY